MYKITEIGLYKLFGSAPILSVVINEIIMQQNRINSLHHNENPLEFKRRCSNIPGRLHQMAACPTQELKSIATDWAVGLHRNHCIVFCRSRLVHGSDKLLFFYSVL